jgi:phosphatidylethanolamine/phosphatidyl-N-methylethanolamine N-methyltransferase
MSLSNEEAHYYSEYYEKALGTGLLGAIQASIHRYMNSRLKKSSYGDVLEVGAGSLEHLLAADNLDFRSYLASDIRYKDESLVLNLKQKLNGNLKGRVNLEFGNAEELEYQDNSFDLLIATCLLIHLPNPEKALNEWRRVLKSGSELVVYVPCEPGIALRIGRRLAVIPKHRKLGFEDYSLVCAREHISSLPILAELIKHTFKKDSIKIHTWPIPYFRFWNLNLAFFYHIVLNKEND